MAYVPKVVTRIARPYVRNYQERQGGPNNVKGVVIHHCAGFFDNSWQFLQRSPNSSAHFIVGQNQVVASVECERAAWHAANGEKNQTTIGIEHANSTGAPTWQVTDLTLRTSAKLMAELSRHYGWGKFQHGRNLWIHKEVSQLGTACPGPYLSTKINYLIDLANKELDGQAPEQKKIPDNANNFPDKGRIRVIGFNGVNIREKPNFDAKVVMNCHKGMVFNYWDKNGDWARTASGYMNLRWTELVGDNQLYQVVAVGLRIRAGAGTNFAVTGDCPQGLYTITEKKGEWGKLKSGVGWIFLGNGYAYEVK